MATLGCQIAKAPAGDGPKFTIDSAYGVVSSVGTASLPGGVGGAACGT